MVFRIAFVIAFLIPGLRTVPMPQSGQNSTSIPSQGALLLLPESIINVDDNGNGFIPSNTGMIPKNRGPSTTQNGLRAMQQQAPNTRSLDSFGNLNDLAGPSPLNQDCLNRHNQVRQQLGLNLMQLSPELIQAAEMRVAELSTNQSPNQGKLPYGLNTIIGDPSDPGMGGVTPGSCDSAFTEWMKGKAVYRGQPIGQGNLDSYGTYTQIIWPFSVQLGCAERQGGSQYYQICLYKSPGNIRGKSLNVY